MTNNQLTKEWLQQTIAELESVRDEIPFGIDTNSELELAAFKLALAAMDSVPVESGEYGDVYQGAREDLAIWKRRALEAEESVRRLEQINDHLVKEAQGEYRMGEPVIAQPASLVPDDVSGPLAHAYKELTPTFMRNHIAVFERYGIAPNDSSTVIQALRIALDGIERRAAMFQAEPVTSANKLGNSPVIPDGYVMVPKEPTGKQWAAGVQAFDSGMDKVTRIYKAMLAAAPQEVK